MGLRIDGLTELIAHIGYPTHSFKSPLIYNPWFAHCGANAAVVPFACDSAPFEALLPALLALPNVRGALITMPHKVRVCGMVDELSATARVAGACNAVKRLPDGRLHGDMFDGEGFVQGALAHGIALEGARALVVGAGGVGSAIAASLAAAGVGHLSLFDVNAASADSLADRLRAHYPHLSLSAGARDPSGHRVVVNATPLGMNESDPLPLDASRLEAGSFVGEVVMRTAHTPLLQAALARGCQIQVGTDMLFAQIPSYLAYFGLPVATPAQLRSLAEL